MAVKYVFVTGGVVSGLGKGITAASLGRLLKMRGYKVTSQKFDPYINIDPGTMNPIQHGEVFVTDDGAETDLDLGHYERFIDESLNKNSNVTTGKVYWSILQKERHGDFGGHTVQVVPHITNEIKDRFYRNPDAKDTEVAIIEIGGTVRAHVNPDGLISVKEQRRIGLSHGQLKIAGFRRPGQQRAARGDQGGQKKRSAANRRLQPHPKGQKNQQKRPRHQPAH